MALSNLEALTAAMAHVSKDTGMTLEELASMNSRSFNTLAMNVIPRPKRSDDLIEEIIRFKHEIFTLAYVKRHYTRATGIGGGVNPEIHAKHEPYILLKYYKDGSSHEFTLRQEHRNSTTSTIFNKLLATIEDITEMSIEEFSEGTFNYE